MTRSTVGRRLGHEPAEGDRKIHHVLWTGGVDSTYRVLSLLRSGRTVQPYYLLETDRFSLRNELAAMMAIRRAIGEAYLGGKLLRLCVSVVEELPADPEVASAFSTVRERFYLGGQYEWLARFARTLHKHSLELSVHRDDRAYECIAQYLAEEGGDGTAHGGDHAAELVTAYAKLFGRFVFPLLDMTKVDMWNDARDHGFRDIMQMTWFCFRPTRWDGPCGRCNPCQYAIQEGLGWRVPRWRRVVAALDPTVAMRQWVAHHGAGYRLVRSMARAFRRKAPP